MTGIAHERLQFFYKMVHHTMTVLHLLVGIAFLITPTSRFVAPQWDPFRALAGGYMWPWGVLLVVIGVLLAFGGTRMDAIGSFLGLCWMALMSSLFVLAFAEDPRVGPIGAIIFGVFMALNAAIFTQNVLNWSDDRWNAKDKRG